MRASLVSLVFAAAAANAHMLAWTKGMYCKNGHSNKDDPNAAVGALPLIDLPFSGWFMHGACINYPPPKGEFLDLPAGGEFTVEIAENRAFTTLSYNGSKTSDWGDGNPHPEGYGDRRVDTHFPLTEIGCISSPNMHCKNEGDAAGTAFAIAYKSDIHQVTMDDLVVFTVAPNTPYKRIAKYKVPKLLPACPPEGCICAWGWVPNHCGEANEYMAGYRCRVTNVQPGAKRVGKPKSPVWCEGEPDKCVKGPKKMSIGFQREGNTVHPVRDVPQADGQWRSWGYNMKLGFAPGAQNDIFVDGGEAATTSKPVPRPTSAVSKPQPAPTPAPKPAPAPAPAPKPAPAPAPKPSVPAPAPAPSSPAPAPAPAPSSSQSTVGHSSSHSTVHPIPIPTAAPAPSHSPSSSVSVSSSSSSIPSEPVPTFLPEPAPLPPSHSAPAPPKPTSNPKPAPNPKPVHTSPAHHGHSRPHHGHGHTRPHGRPSKGKGKGWGWGKGKGKGKGRGKGRINPPRPQAFVESGSSAAADADPEQPAPKPTSNAAPKPTSNAPAPSKPAENAANPTSKPAENALKPTSAPVNVAAPPKSTGGSAKRCPAKLGARSLQSPGAARFRHRRSAMSFLDRFHV